MIRFFLGGKPCIICSDLEFLMIMQIKESKLFSIRDVIIPDGGIPHNLMYETFLIKKDESWEYPKRILAEYLTSTKVKMMSPLMRDQIKIFLENIEKRINQPFEIMELYRKLILDIMCRINFGLETTTQVEGTSKFIKSLCSLFYTNPANILIALSILFPEIEPLPTNLRLIVDRIKHVLKYPSAKVVFDTCKEIVANRKNLEYPSPDLLQHILNEKDISNGQVPYFTTNASVANAFVLMGSSFDTTVISLSWCTYYLSRYPAIQEKVRLEINSHVENNREIQFDDLSSFIYLDQVISETLRLQPFSTLLVNRMSSTDYKYKDMIIPKGVTIMVPVRNLQADSDYWEEPHKFDPDRFYHNNPVPKSLVYQPFGAGPRMCLGKNLAQILMKFILATTIRSFKLEFEGSEDIEEHYSMFVTHPKNGVNIRAEKIS